ncbi:uncharacterized protein PG986_012794 [Apiospora aurea]|uniref:Uncharacterized protein n=1 Tax=Apiospora aurea TaxID=335848 RepID=A0ABR1Q0Z8_9PEZI
MQGFNMGRYVPPDLEGTASGNQVNRKHALGHRASKLASQGILTVRFEMPFAMWCGHCPKPTIIGQGVRFNAEKKKVGNYYSTPIYSFRMRHAQCGGALEIRTDPKNTAYEVVEGGRRREDRTDEPDGEGGRLEIITDQEREKLRSSAFAKLEKTIEDREQLAHAKLRIEELEDASRVWEDPYEQNRRLRREFRVGRHAREKEGRASEDLRDRMSLGIDLVPAHEDDARRAALVEFNPVANSNGTGDNAALSKPLFGNGAAAAQKTPSSGVKRRLKSETATARMKESLVSEIVGNTRAAHDPFLVPSSSNGVAARLSGIKRKRIEEKETEPPCKELPKEDTGMKKASTALVTYDSDSS